MCDRVGTYVYYKVCQNEYKGLNLTFSTAASVFSSVCCELRLNGNDI